MLLLLLLLSSNTRGTNHFHCPGKVFEVEHGWCCELELPPVGCCSKTLEEQTTAVGQLSYEWWKKKKTPICKDRLWLNDERTWFMRFMNGEKCWSQWSLLSLVIWRCWCGEPQEHLGMVMGRVVATKVRVVTMFGPLTSCCCTGWGQGCCCTSGMKEP